VSVAFSTSQASVGAQPVLEPGSQDFGTWLSGPATSDAEVQTVLVYPSIVHDDDGSTVNTYAFPDGSTMSSTTPPPNFDPLKADIQVLTKYGFPLPPSDTDEYVAWYAAMEAFRYTPPTADPVEFATRDDPDFATNKYHKWAGYIAGSIGVQAHTYVAVKGNLVVPTNTTSCGGNPTHSVGLWIGLGGTGPTGNDHNLVQQGIACGKSQLGSLTSYHPFYEFANTDLAQPFCGPAWTVNAGHVIYQNMSFQTSSNTAYFYLEDQTTGVARPCNFHPPSGWGWNLNTSEWIGESSLANPANFGSVHFTNARAELYSNSTWVTVGSQSNLREYQGWQYFETDGHIYKCIDSSALDAGGAGFTLTWVNPTCNDPDE